MPEFNEKQFLIFNQIGLIPGPHEQEESFIKRVNYCLNLKDHLPEEIKNPLSKEAEHKPEVLIESADHLKMLYDCSPKWTLLFFSNYKLPVWQGGCAWIFQMSEESPTSALIQMRQTFKNSAKYLGIYNRKELLTHELSHVGRMMFQEPKFEELIAYRTAKTSLRRRLGPLVQSSMESALFFLFLFMLIVFDAFLLALDRPDAYMLALWLKIIPITVFIAALGRLWKRQKTYDSCLENIKKCVEPEKAQAVAYRLQDHEITLFSSLSEEKINEYAATQAKNELRWKIIYKAYFKSI